MGEHATSRAPQHASFGQELWQAAQAGSALYLLYSFAAHVASGVGALGGRQTGEAAAVVPIIKVTLPDPIAELVIACIVTGIITYMALRYVCESKWVQEPVKVKECWEEITWNPWSWVKAVVCTVKEVLKWVLKLICSWIWVLVVLLVITCIVVGIILLA